MDINTDLTKDMNAGRMNKMERDVCCVKRSKCKNYMQLCESCTNVDDRVDQFETIKKQTGWRCGACEFGPCYKMTVAGVTSGGNPGNDNLCLMTHGGYNHTPQKTVWCEFYGKVVD
jgi:hypothetical protein